MIHQTYGARNPVRTQDVAIYEGGRVVGAVRTTAPGKPFVKTVDSRKHMLRSPKAWAVGLESLTSAEAAGTELVLLYDHATGDTYAAPTTTIRERGFRMDRGHGAQLVLILGEWSKNGEPPQAEAKRQAEAAKASDNGQLTLFDFAEPQRIGAY